MWMEREHADVSKTGRVSTMWTRFPELIRNCMWIYYSFFIVFFSLCDRKQSRVHCIGFKYTYGHTYTHTNTHTYVKSCILKSIGSYRMYFMTSENKLLPVFLWITVVRNGEGGIFNVGSTFWYNLFVIPPYFNNNSTLGIINRKFVSKGKN